MKRVILYVIVGLVGVGLGIVVDRMLLGVNGRHATVGQTLADGIQPWYLQEGECEVHMMPFKTELMPIVYGLRLPTYTRQDSAEMAIDPALFPHSIRSVPGGCEPYAAQVQDASFCPLCRINRAAWELGYETGGDTAALLLHRARIQAALMLGFTAGDTTHISN